MQHTPALTRPVALVVVVFLLPSLCAAQKAVTKPDPTLIQSAAQLKERMKTELQATRPDYVAFVPQVTDERGSDTGNEEFHV